MESLRPTDEIRSARKDSGNRPGNRLRFGFGFAQTDDAVSLLPLAPFLKEFHALEPFEYVALSA
jgi:hypothetical protein